MSDALLRADAAVEPATAAYLKRLGERVRNVRARRGMTRKILSRDSGVSERYLAQLESGRGNVSIVLLRQIAAAMGLPVQDLVREGPERPVEIALILEQLNRLQPAELAEAQAWFAGRFGAKAERSHRIALIGLRGAGKTTLGKALAERLGVPFVELAQEIETVAGLRLSEIFDLSGQAAFRRYERQALDEALARHPRCVIATGGSLVSEAGTYEHLLAHCFTVWLRAAPEEHMQRVMAQGDFRPMAGNREAMNDLHRILAQREALYAKADATLETSGRSVAALADELGMLAR